MEKVLLNKLKLAGLTKREAHIYMALLQKKELTASEIASIIPISRTKIYEVIPNLVSKGFCSEVQKDGKRIYSAVEPKIALKSLLISIKQNYEETIKSSKEIFEKKSSVINELENQLTKIHSENIKKQDNIDYIEVIKDRNQIRDRWLTIQKHAKLEELAFNKPPYSITPQENIQHEKELIKRNVICKGIYEYDDSSMPDSSFIEMLESFANIGEEVRVINKLPMKLAIIDERVSMLALNDPVSLKPSITTMVITHPSFALAQKEVFESYWNKAVPFKEFKKNIKMKSTS